MRGKLYSLWQKISKPLEVLSIIVVCLLTITLIVVIILSYAFNFNMPGLHGKTLWDWLQLLIIPAVLAIGGYFFNYTVSRNERQAAEQRAQIEREAASKRDQTERDIATDNQQEAALQTYIDKISELLIEKHLRESKAEDEVRTIARVRTLTTLPRLDGARKGNIIQFLYESQLIDKGANIINLEGSDLSEATLYGATLNGANFSRANLRGADLNNTHLKGADLGAAHLGTAFLNQADLSETDLSRATIYSAHLFRADLSRANLNGANLNEADLNGANLNGANLNGANLNGADLSEVKLNDTIVTQKQLDKAKSLKGATVRVGSKLPLE